MARIDERLSMIEEAILAQARAESQEIIARADQNRRSELDKNETIVLEEMYDRIQEEISEIREDSIRAVSDAQFKARQELLLRREQLASSVFSAVAGRLSAFASSEDYQSFFEACLSRAAKECPIDGSVFLVREQDLKLEEAIRRIYPKPCQVQADPSIRLGGFKLINQGAGLCMDETLDSRLSDQKSWFYEHSGLSIE